MDPRYGGRLCRAGPPRPPAKLAAGGLVAVILQGFGIAGGALSTVLWMALIGFTFGGMAHGVKNVLLRTLIHERAPEALRGRVFAAYNGARNGAELGALVLGGVVVGALGARAALLARGVRAGRDRRRLPAASHHAAAAPRRRPQPTKGEFSMHVSKDELKPMVFGEYEGRQADAGEMRIAFESMPAQFPPDESPFKGLPDDRCQCDHWGYLFKGAFRVTYTDGPEEVVHAGEAYHLRPGHFVQTLEPVELIELSPAEEHDRTMATIARNVGLVAS